MLTDARLVFVPDVAPLSIVAAAGVSVPSNVLDLMDVGVGLPPPNIIGNASVFQTDLGVGVRHPNIAIAVGVAFTTATGATLNIALQGAPDTGAGGGYQPGTWTTITETGPIPVTSLTAQTALNKMEITPDLAPFPRFLRLLFQVPAATDFTAGTIAYAKITFFSDNMRFGYNNFSSPQ